MENAHYFLHVTDTHLCFDAEAPDICCTEQALRSLYQTAFAWDHRPAFVLITGDLVHEGTSADYARAKTLLQELDEQAIISRVTSKSAMTPSFMGRTARMRWGVRPR